MSHQVCTRADHPERPHWHYGPAGRYWCTDRFSPLLMDSDGKLYSRQVAANG
jgi:hypothetical protein